MRIGLFTDTYPPFINGVSTSIVMLKRALENAGHEVFVITVNNEKMSYHYDSDNNVVRIPGIPVGIYDYRLTSIYSIKALNQIKKWKLDVIHSHTEFGIGTFSRIIAKQLNIPVVHTYHTMYEDYVHYITKGYFKGTSKKIVEYLTKFYCDITIDELIVPTKKTYDLFKKNYKVERSVHIIPTGIEVERFYTEQFKKSDLLNLRESHGIDKNDFVILFVGRLSKEKRVEFLIENHKNLVKSHKNCKLLIVGDGPDDKTYKKLVSKLKLDENVIFTGKVPWEEVPKYYALSDVFATASDTETQGLTVIEAHAASLPVVALLDESFKNVVIPNLNGYLFKNKREYLNSVDMLIRNPETLKRFQIQARNSAELHSSKYFADRVLNVYELAIKRSNRNLRNKKKKRIIDRIKRWFGGRKKNSSS